MSSGSSNSARGLKPPKSATGDVKDAFKKALIQCSDAYLIKATGYNQMAKVLDGDRRPSAVGHAKQAMEAAQLGQFACIAGFMSAATEAGLPADVLTDGS